VAITIPPGVDANGRRNVIFSPTSTLSAATLAGASSVELICYLTKGSFGMASETERGTDDRECTTQSAEVMGNTSYSVNDLDYVWEPQAATGSATNKAYEVLKNGTTGFLIVRYGLPHDTALAAGQKVDVVPVTVGPQIRKAPEGDNPAEKLKIVQSVAVGQGVLFDQVLVA
jgi:hypothetical protein